MPNHVYSTISVEDKYIDKLIEIAEVGLCRHYHPMPEELDLQKYYDKTHDNPYGEDWVKFRKEQEDWIIKQKKENLKTYGAEDWYAWCTRYDNWNTKWGCYDGEVEGSHYHFTTAWAPVADHIIAKLTEDIPNFEYEWEEEQGFGEYREFENGVQYKFREWDIPEWSTERWENDERYDDKSYGDYDITTLQKPYTDREGVVRKRGFYLDYDLEHYMGNHYEKAVEELLKIKKDMDKIKKKLASN